MFAIVLLRSSPAPAKPLVTWSPFAVFEELTFDQSKTVSVQFTPSEDLTQVIVHIVPELQPFVTAMPLSFNSIDAGATTTIELTLTNPDDALGSFDGVIQLRSQGDAKGVFAKPLAIELNLDPTRVTERDSGVSFAVPPGLVPRFREDGVSFFNPEATFEPAIVSVFIIDIDPLDLLQK